MFRLNLQQPKMDTGGIVAGPVANMGGMPGETKYNPILEIVCIL